LKWTAEHGRILVTLDRRTTIGHFNDFLADGGFSPGLLLIRNRNGIVKLVEILEIIAHAGHPKDFANRVLWIP